MTQTTATFPESTTASRSEADAHAEAASAADQRIAALRSQLAMVQAERSLLHTRSASPSSPPAARSGHGAGGWIFAGFSFVFFIAMMVFAATRPPAVRVVEVEVTREVLVPVAAEPAATVATVTPEAEPTAPTGAIRTPSRPRVNGSSTTTTTSSTMSTTPMIEFDRCGGDPLCGS